MDEKTHLDDHEAYSADSFRKARSKPNFKKFESSWVEKRAYIHNAVNALEDSPLAAEARQRLEEIRPRLPDLTQWQAVTENEVRLENPLVELHFDKVSAEMTAFRDLQSKQDWCSSTRRMGSYTYQTFSSGDYERFISQYILPSMQTSGWAIEDFGKPGLEKAKPASRIWKPEVTGVYRREDAESASLLFRMNFDEEAVEEYGAPAKTYIKYSVRKNEKRVSIDLQWFKKNPCRMPEALWFSFVPEKAAGMEWEMEKLGKWISPLSVVENGNRHLHAVGTGVRLGTEPHSLLISPLDSALVAPGQRSLLDFNNDQPDLSKGMHFCLLNNLWGTNFPMWFEEDCRFRFEIEFKVSVIIQADDATNPAVIAYIVQSIHERYIWKIREEHIHYFGRSCWSALGSPGCWLTWGSSRLLTRCSC